MGAMLWAATHGLLGREQEHPLGAGGRQPWPRGACTLWWGQQRGTWWEEGSVLEDGLDFSRQAQLRRGTEK